MHYQSLLQFLIVVCCITPKFSIIWFFIELRLTCHKCFFQPLMIKIKPIFCYCWFSLEVKFWVLSFYFISYDSLLCIITTCAYNPCSRAIILKSVLTSLGMFWGSFTFFLQWSKNSVGNNLPFLYVSSITSYIDLQICWF